jgi:LDH2 family malate/lactate/ureidoglycolate dehydrogenase
MYTRDFLFDFTKRVFMKMGCSETDSAIIADIFLAAELRGHSSHGMIRIKDYHELWKAGRINVNPRVRIVHDTPSTAVVDGDNAIGMIAARRSMEIAIEKAQSAGTGWVATRNSNHFGIAGYYAMMALRNNMTGICLTNANPLVSPTFSVSRMMGTNPIAVAIPAGKQPRWSLILPPLPLQGANWLLQRKRERKCRSALFRINTGILLTIRQYSNPEDRC